jgi:hypothetical protein
MCKCSVQHRAAQNQSKSTKTQSSNPTLSLILTQKLQPDAQQKANAHGFGSGQPVLR